MRGSWGGVPVNADWHIGDNSQTPTPEPALLGNFGKDAVNLRGDFRLARSYFFEQAEIVWDLGATALRTVVSAVDGGLGSTDALVAEGTLGETPFELYAALSLHQPLTTENARPGIWQRSTGASRLNTTRV